MADATAGSSSATGRSTRLPDLDPRSVVPFAVAIVILGVTVWFIRSVPRTLTALAIGALIALALNPLVEALQRRARWPRRYAAATVLVGFFALFAVAVALVTAPTIDQVRRIDEDIPEVVKGLEDLPIIGGRLRDADAANEVQRWLDELPDRLDVDATPIEKAVGTVADGVAAAFLTLLLAITLLLDGDYLVEVTRRVIPARNRPAADRLGRLIYDLIGRYVAGSLFVAALAGVVMLVSSLLLGVPLAPLIGAWVAMTNLIPQIGGFLGALPFVLLGVTESPTVGLACLAIFVVYQNIENHILQPLIVGKAVKLSPPATMVAALVGVSAGGVVGALFAVPILGASKAIYLAFRDGSVSAARVS